MRFGRRRPGLPVEIRAALGIEGDVRVLAWSPLTGAGAIAATVDGLRIFTPRGQLIARSWVDVDHAAWDQDSSTLAVWWVGRRQATPLEIEDDDGRLPETIRERVQASVVLATSVALPDGRSARIALRRGADGTITTQSLLPPGMRSVDPGIAPVLARAVAELREDAGLSGPEASGSFR